jgi:Zn-finger nucleic acid-binding protein
MNCSNCGAAMDLVDGRHYFFCTHCGSFHFPEAATDQGVRVTRRNASDAHCGVCNRPLAHAVLQAGAEVQYCENCRGVLLSRAHFAAVVDRQRAWASSPPVVPTPLDRQALGRSMRCPTCRGDMSTHPYYGPGNVIIDTCDTCDQVWLDFGELKQIVDAPGQDRGRRERPARSSGDDVDLFAMLAGRVARDERAD